MSKKYSKELNYMSKSTLLYMLKDISNCLIEKHDYDYNGITMYIDNCYMSCDAFIKKYFKNSGEKTKSFIKKVYNRNITKDDYEDLIEALFE